MMELHLISPEAAARILDLSERRLRRLALQGRIPYVELPGGEIRFDPRDLAAWIDSRRHLATPSIT